MYQVSTKAASALISSNQVKSRAQHAQFIAKTYNTSLAYFTATHLEQDLDHRKEKGSYKDQKEEKRVEQEN